MTDVIVALEAKRPDTAQRLVATVTLGLAEAVRAGALSTADACGLFFVPAYLALRRKRNIDKGLIAALHAGSELNDVERLAPKGLPRALNEVSEDAKNALLKLGPCSAPLRDKWFVVR
jgi:hypothetical protein